MLQVSSFDRLACSRLIVRAAQNDVDLDTRLANIRRIVHELPRPRFDLLKRLVEHLDK